VGRWGLAVGLWAAVARGGAPEARQAAHWLRYVAADYGGAVRQGKIVHQEEYDEQLALLDRAAGLLATLPEEDPSRGAIRRLRGLVEARGAAEELAPLARATAERLLRSAGGSAPAAVPSLARGREVYGRACASCHGADGGGRTPIAAQLRPPPADLIDPVKNEERSPLGVALAVEFGIPGTAMVPRPELSEGERWDVAFFAAALPWEAGREGEAHPDGEAPALSLEELTLRSNRELRAALGASGLAPERIGSAGRPRPAAPRPPRGAPGAAGGPLFCCSLSWFTGWCALSGALAEFLCRPRPSTLAPHPRGRP
jgi:high-affinity iron transporter